MDVKRRGIMDYRDSSLLGGGTGEEPAGLDDDTREDRTAAPALWLENLS